MQLAKIHEDVSYLLAISRWFPLNDYLKDRATATFRIAFRKASSWPWTDRADQRNSEEQDVYTFVNERPTFPGSLRS